MALAVLPSDLRLVVLAYCLTLYSASGRPTSAGPPSASLVGRLPHQVAIRDGTLVINVLSRVDDGRGGRSFAGAPWQSLGSWLRWWWTSKRAQRLQADEQAWVDAIHHTAANVFVLCLQARASLLSPLLSIPIGSPRARSSWSQAPTSRSWASRCRRMLAAIALAAVLGEVELVTLVCAHRYLERRQRRQRLQLVIHGSSPGLPTRSSAPSDGTRTPATCPICAADDGENPDDPIESFCSAAPHQHLFHRSCLTRWLRTFTADQALDGGGSGEVVVGRMRQTADSLVSVPASVSEALQELFWRAGLFLDLRTKHEPVGRPAIRGPPVTRISLDSSAVSFFSHDAPSAASWCLFRTPPTSFPSSLGLLRTSAPPCPTCRSPLDFRLSLAKPAAAPSDECLRTLWIATWSALVSGETFWSRCQGLAGAVALLAVLQKLPNV